MMHEQTILHALHDQAIRELQTETCAGPITYWNGFRDAMSLALEATRPQAQSAKEKERERIQQTADARERDSFDADDGPDSPNATLHPARTETPHVEHNAR